MSLRLSNHKSKILKLAGLVGVVFFSGLLSGYFIFRPINPQTPARTFVNPYIHQFHGALFFEDWGEDDVMMSEIDGNFSLSSFTTSFELFPNFTATSWERSYYLNQTTIDWSYPGVHIPTTPDVHYINITVNSSELCDWAIVNEETVSNENVTMHRITGTCRPMGLYQDGGVSWSSFGSPHFVLIGDDFIIVNNISVWNSFMPHSIYDDLNVTYNYRMEFFHEVAGQPELLLSVRIPTIEFRVWDDPTYMWGLDRDFSVKAYCSYLSIVDITGNYPLWFSHPNLFNYNFSATFTYH